MKDETMPARMLLVLLIAAVALCPLSVIAQQPAGDVKTPPAAGAQAKLGFDDVADCQSLKTKLVEVETQSKDLDEVLAQPAADTEALLKGIFIGTQIMLGYGDALFQTTAQHEGACKDALRSAEKSAEIIRIYELLLDPTLRGYDFLQRVKTSAEALGDADTAADMETALSGYAGSMRQLIGFCEGDVPEDKSAALCGNFRAQVEARIGVPPEATPPKAKEDAKADTPPKAKEDASK